MFSTKQVRPLTNVLSHVYTRREWMGENLREFKTRMVSVPVNMVIVSNDMDKLYDTTEKIATYFDRFINFHYNHTIVFGENKKDSFEFYEEVVGRAANIREVDLDKLDTEHKGQIVSSAFQFDLIYWVVNDPGVNLRLLKKIILEIKTEGSDIKKVITITEDDVTEQDVESDVVIS